MTKEVLPFKVGDKVVRPDVEGPAGTVKSIRVETVRDSLRQGEEETPGITVTVLWDNGTLSHFIPDALEKSK